MKKLLSLTLVLLLVLGAFTLVSCGDKKVKIGVQSGTTGEAFLKGNADMGFAGFENVDTQSYDNAALAVTDMRNGNIKYVVIDAAVGKSLAATNSDIKVIDFALTREDFGIGVDKAQPQLLEQINQVLANKRAEIDAIYATFANVTDENSANWTGSSVEAGTYDASKNQLVVATNAAFAPYEFTVGNKFAGIDIEIAKLIATELGMELVIQNMEFEAVVSSIGKHGVDVAISGLTITPARSQVINFSTPYEQGSYQVILAMKNDTTFDACTSAEQVLAILKELED